ncbi:MAG: glycine hydroxymethyltransferase [Oscillospiraceae bacterium]|nr:glycine hydroxymethyltransferase [Oscillospiraceae bacterium]
MSNSTNLLLNYLAATPQDKIDAGAISFLANIEKVKEISPDIAESIINELRDQRTHLKLIASENFSSLSVQAAMGNLLTDKYAEGYPYHRFYAGCDNVDKIEAEAVKLACELFGADYAYVQPHSGADANMVAFLSILLAKVQDTMLKDMGVEDIAQMSRDDFNKIRDAYGKQKLLALDYYSGGHLTHGYRHNYSSILFDVYSYTVDRETKLLDLDALREQLHEVKPLVFLAGYSAYPRKINFAKMRELADEVGAVFMVDMAHFAGLVAGGVFDGDYNPVPYAHMVTSTTHKTLRGPRGGFVLCQEEYKDYLDKGCPLFLGGPLPHVMAAKAVAFKEANTPDFKEYAANITKNSAALAQALIDRGVSVITGGTDNHLMLLDVQETYGLSGRQGESALRDSGFTLNRNALPFDVNGPWYTSGIRIGTPAVTTLGMGESEMVIIAELIDNLLRHTESTSSNRTRYETDPAVAKLAKEQVQELLSRFPLYPEIVI